MAKEGKSSVTAAPATNDMTKFPDTTNPLYPDYLRMSETKGTYKCSTTGLVTQETTGY